MTTQLATAQNTVVGPTLVGPSGGDDLPLIQAFINAFAGKTCFINAGEYNCDSHSSDNNTILIPANTTVLCQKGAIFRSSYWYSPLFAILHADNVVFTGAQFKYAGAWYPTGGSGARTFLTYTLAVAFYRYSSDVVILGSNSVNVQITSVMPAETNVKVNSVMMDGMDDGVTMTKHNTVNVTNNGRCNAIMHANQFKPRITVDQRVLSTNSNGLYGPPHAVYDFIDRPTYMPIYDIRDSGEWPVGVLDADTPSAHTLSAKNVSFMGGVLKSNRSCGPLNWTQLDNTDLLIDYYYNGTMSSSGLIYYTAQGTTSKNNTFRGKMIYDTPGPTSIALFSTYNAITTPVNETTIDMEFYRNVNGTTAPMLLLGDVGCVANIIVSQIGNDGRSIVDFRPTANNIIVNANIKRGGSRATYNAGNVNCQYYSSNSLALDLITMIQGQRTIDGLLLANRGTAIVALATTSIVVTHGLYKAPAFGEIKIAPVSSPTASGSPTWWFGSITATTFTINTSVAPTGAALTFSWNATCLGG